MSDYLSGRELSLKIGVSSYTESNLVLDVIGRTNLGVTSVTNLTANTFKSTQILGGIVTATKFVGDGSELTGITASSIVGIISYALNSGTANNVIGGIANVTSLNVTGPSTISGAQISGGIVTATKFVGDGSELTGITAGGIVGTITYATNAGFANSAASANYAQTAGISTVARGLTGTPNITAGIITATSFVGNLTGNANAATYAVNSGISTNVIGGIGSVTSLSVSGISTLGLVKISAGIITATSGNVTYYGDGSNLTGLIPNTVGLSSASIPQFINFSSTSSGVTSSILASSTFVYVPSSGNLGIGTTTPITKLDLFGNIRLSAGSGIGTSTSARPSLTFIGIATQFNYSGVANTNAVEIKAYARDNGTLVFNGYGNQILTLNDDFADDLFVVSKYTPKPYSFIEAGASPPTEFIEQSFRIDRAGNTIVGIGTSIRAKLDVRGSVILGVAHTAITTPFNVLAVSPQRINGDVTIFGLIRPRQPFSDLSNSPTTNHIIVSPTTGDTGSLNFYTGTASTTRIPDQILSLTNNVSGSLFRVNSPVVGFGSTTNLSIGSTITAIFEVNRNGNVGVGTSVPTSTLHVQGNATITGITTFGLEATSAPTINRTMSFELTNNNTLTVRVRGTDGLVRTGIIALVP